MQLIRDSIDLSEFMGDAEPDHAVNPASHWLDGVIDHFYKPAEAPLTRLGWRKTHADFQFRSGEVTLWAGINGHGKSQMVGQVALDLMLQSERVCMASLEMHPVRTMARMARQAHGSDEPPRRYLQQFATWTDDKLWLYEHVGSCAPAVMLAVIRYAVSKFGVTHFIVDNLMKIVAGEDAYNEQKDFVNGLCTIAHDTGVHIHLVLHVKKGKDEHDVPGKFAIKGSGAITDLVDNVFIVWRNKAKEAAIRAGGDNDPDNPDALLCLEKQRNGEAEGRYGFWFDRHSMQYLESRLDHPKMLRVEREITAQEVEF
jgi:twinkle protein